MIFCCVPSFWWWFTPPPPGFPHIFTWYGLFTTTTAQRMSLQVDIASPFGGGLFGHLGSQGLLKNEIMRWKWQKMKKWILARIREAQEREREGGRGRRKLHCDDFCICVVYLTPYYFLNWISKFRICTCKFKQWNWVILPTISLEDAFSKCHKKCHISWPRYGNILQTCDFLEKMSKCLILSLGFGDILPCHWHVVGMLQTFPTKSWK